METLDVSAFKLKVPEGWKYQKMQGIDSFVGGIVGDGIELSFDYGCYSNSLVNEGDEGIYNITYKTVDGRSAKFVSPNESNNEASPLTGVYFERVEGEGGLCNDIRFNLVGSGLTQDQIDLTFKIFETIDFED